MGCAAGRYLQDTASTGGTGVNLLGYMTPDQMHSATFGTGKGP